jgi:hypothetical protein
MLTARQQASATLLPNGKVLVAGGLAGAGTGGTNRAELYDPSSGTWTATGSMNTGRTRHTATLLPNGKVLVAGGLGSNFPFFLASAELYDPTTGSWTNTGSLNSDRIDHNAILLANGNVIVMGGQNGSSNLNSAEIFNPATGMWTNTSSMTSPRVYFATTLLVDGSVLATGSGSTAPSATNHLWTLKTNSTKNTHASCIHSLSTKSGQGPSHEFRLFTQDVLEPEKRKACCVAHGDASWIPTEKSM